MDKTTSFFVEEFVKTFNQILFKTIQYSLKKDETDIRYYLLKNERKGATKFEYCIKFLSFTVEKIIFSLNALKVTKEGIDLNCLNSFSLIEITFLSNGIYKNLEEEIKFLITSHMQPLLHLT